MTLWSRMQRRLRSTWANLLIGGLGVEAAFHLSTMRCALQELVDLNDERNLLDTEMSDVTFWARSQVSKADFQNRLDDHNRKVIVAWINARTILLGLKIEEDVE